MTTYTGYTETPEQIAARWERWCKRADEIEAAQAAQTKEPTSAADLREG